MSDKFCFIDVETTGLDSKAHNIFQISAIITDAKLKTLNEINLRFKPFDNKRIEPEALEKTGLTIEEITDVEMTSKEAYDELIEFLSRYCDRYNKADKLYLVAYNAPFDADFLREFFAKHDDQYFGSWFWHPALCVMQLAAWTLVNGGMEIRPKMPHFKLETLCKIADLEWSDEDAHDAAYDNRMTVKLLKAVKAL